MQGNSARSSSSQRVAAIDILRLVAACYVLIFHVAADAGIPKRELPAFDLLGHRFTGIPSPFSFGATGVSLFFVISGYCMYRSLAGRSPSVTAYFRDRLARIYPIYGGAVIFSYIVCIFLHTNIAPVDVIIKLFFLQGFLQNFHLTLNGAFWSMATEVQFYVTLPLLFALSRKIGCDRFVLLMIAVALSFRFYVDWRWYGQPPVAGIVKSTFLMNLLPGRIAEFAIGMWIAATPPNRSLNMSYWIILPGAIGAAVSKIYGPAPIAEPLFGIFYGCILVIALRRAAAFGEANSKLALAGRASYALFLIHLPISLVAVRYMPSGLGLYSGFFYLLFVTLSCAVPLSLALYSWVEMPLFRRLRSSNLTDFRYPRARDAGAP